MTPQTGQDGPMVGIGTYRNLRYIGYNIKKFSDTTYLHMVIKIQYHVVFYRTAPRIHMHDTV
jgi:hypothetical protein